MVSGIGLSNVFAVLKDSSPETGSENGQENRAKSSKKIGTSLSVDAMLRQNYDSDNDNRIQIEPNQCDVVMRPMRVGLRWVVL